MGDAAEMLVAAELTLSGVPALKVPDNWPGYDVIAQPRNKEPQRISVKCRKFNSPSNVVFKPKTFDWMNKQNPQVAVAALRYLAEDRAVPGRHLLREQAQPGGEVAAFGERISTADRGHHRAGDDWTDAGHAHQPLAAGVLARDGFDLAR